MLIITLLNVGVHFGSICNYVLVTVIHVSAMNTACLSNM